ncbi:MAG TPA: low molecular weight phosphotyrosine protein phosphatase, partial [Arthrobacter sp.]|nr:low molecular weight phosphotyrosine protein phosphatase [Arthrobacter sp.]
MNSSSSPYRIITVCTGNICRSPMAEMMLTAAFQAEGLGSDVSVDSAGTTGYEAGRPIDPRAARRLAVTRLSSGHHVAREWQAPWFSERDLILALDIDHYAWLRDAAPDAESMNKVRMLRSFDPRVA